MTRRSTRIGISAAGMCFAAGLLWLAVPRLDAELTAVTALTRIADGDRVRELDIEQARALASTFEDATNRFQSPRYSHAALKMYYQIQRVAPESARAGYIDVILRSMRRELSARPMQTRTWASLSSFHYFRGKRATDLSRDALLKSVEQREYALSLVPVRLRLILLHWNDIPVARRAELRSQFVQTWRRDPYGLIELARKNKSYATVIRGGLSNEPRMLGGLEVGLGNR